MAENKGFFEKLRAKLFGETKPEAASEASPKNKPAPPKRSPKRARKPKARAAYFFQIGLDFGTSYSKCICRDILLGKSWVYIPDINKGQELPFLIPSVVNYQDGVFSHPGLSDPHYTAEGLSHIKMALRAVAKGEPHDFDLGPFETALGSSKPQDLKRFVELGVIYFLAGCLGGAKQAIRKRLPDFGKNPDDFIAVNCAVPVADAEETEVSAVFDEILRKAWVLSERLANHPKTELGVLESMVADCADESKGSDCRDACYVYPETSANVQGYIRSQSSSPGLYLFTDVGAGTVDQSVFLFSRRQNEERLAYLFSEVSPLGSSQIELHAAKTLNKTDWKTLDHLRQEKERNSKIRPLQDARSYIANRLKKVSCRILASAKEKLIRRQQLESTRLLFGGGGECPNPYRLAVRHPFGGALFRERLTPEELGMPRPNDLELTIDQTRWLPRLSVAYGLSFQQADLAEFKFPRDMQRYGPEEVWRAVSLNSTRVIRGGFVESE